MYRHPAALSPALESAARAGLPKRRLTLGVPESGGGTGLIFRVARYVVERQGAIAIHYLTWVWPGSKRPDPDD